MTSSFYLEVNASVSVLVEYSEYLLDENLSISGRENHGIHVQDLVLGQLAVGAVCLKALVPLPDLLLVVPGVFLQKLDVLLGEGGGGVALVAPAAISDSFATAGAPPACSVETRRHFQTCLRQKM